IDARKIRERSPSFHDHFSQARLFFQSQSEIEQLHIIKALRFELGKVETIPIRKRMLFLLAQVDKELANSVAEGLGEAIPAKLEKPMNMSVPGDMDPKKVQPKRAVEMDVSPALRMIDNPNFPNPTIETRKIAFLVSDGFDDAALLDMKQTLMTAGAVVVTVAPRLGVLRGVNGTEVRADFSFLTGSSVLFDAFYVPDGEASVASLKAQPDVANFLIEAYKHCKTIAASGAGVELLASTGIVTAADEIPRTDKFEFRPGLLATREAYVPGLGDQFVTSIARHRHWEREPAS
ncbi:MAG TPA: catalase-related domain-containing protein, partial [Pyrinomonadaceae bacterium]